MVVDGGQRQSHHLSLPANHRRQSVARYRCRAICGLVILLAAGLSGDSVRRCVGLVTSKTCYEALQGLGRDPTARANVHGFKGTCLQQLVQFRAADTQGSEGVRPGRSPSYVVGGCGFSRRSRAEVGFRWLWVGIEKALAVLRVGVAEPVGLVFVFDAFADH